jgi:hypothetical protein
LTPTTSPPKASTARDLVAYDADRKAVVVYDVAAGVWTLRWGGAAPAVRAALPDAVIKAAAYRPRGKPPVDETVKAWQQKLRSIPDNTWAKLDFPCRPRAA